MSLEPAKLPDSIREVVTLLSLLFGDFHTDDSARNLKKFKESTLADVFFEVINV